MPDQDQTAQVTGTSATTQGSSGAQAGTQALTIPEEVRQKFPDLIPMIEKSPSMNPEERQYWVDVLPIMTEEQIGNLRSILDNEKKQVEGANQIYSKGVQTEKEKVKSQFDEQLYHAKREAREKTERQHEEKEKKDEAALLEEIQTLDV